MQGKALSPPVAALPVETRVTANPTALSVRQLFDLHADFVARLLRNFGVMDADIEDGLQAVFVVVANKLGQIESGAESSFLFRTATWVAARHRRTRDRRREVHDVDLSSAPDSSPAPDEGLRSRDARAALDRALDSMPDDIRVVFVLFEIEEITMKQIAESLGIPAGTVASRLRRARELFQIAISAEAEAGGEAR